MSSRGILLTLVRSSYRKALIAESLLIDVDGYKKSSFRGLESGPLSAETFVLREAKFYTTKLLRRLRIRIQRYNVFNLLTRRFPTTIPKKSRFYRSAK